MKICKHRIKLTWDDKDWYCPKCGEASEGISYTRLLDLQSIASEVPRTRRYLFNGIDADEVAMKMRQIMAWPEWDRHEFS